MTTMKLRGPGCLMAAAAWFAGMVAPFFALAIAAGFGLMPANTAAGAAAVLVVMAPVASGIGLGICLALAKAGVLGFRTGTLTGAALGAGFGVGAPLLFFVITGGIVALAAGTSGTDPGVATGQFLAQGGIGAALFAGLAPGVLCGAVSGLALVLVGFERVPVVTPSGPASTS